jgi:hypothetical protein
MQYTKHESRYYLFWEDLFTVILTKSSNQSLRTGFRRLLAVTQTFVFEQQNTHVNDPSDVFPPNVSLPEACVPPEQPYFPPPGFFDLANDCDLMEFLEDEVEDSEFREADCDSILELMDDESDANNISLDLLDEVFERLNSMIDVNLAPPNSQYPTQSFNLPEELISPPHGICCTAVDVGMSIDPRIYTVRKRKFTFSPTLYSN